MKPTFYQDMFCFSALRQMQTADLLGLLAIVIALSAYLAAVRLFAIGAIKEASNDEKRKIKTKLGWLVLADAPMTVSAVLLGLYTLWAPMPHWMLLTGIALFTFAGLMLLFFHTIAWMKSLFSTAWMKSLFSTKKRAS